MEEALRQYLNGVLAEQIRRDAAGRLAVARQWPGFREHEQMIRRAMVADDDLSLWEAYRQVMLGEGSGWALTPEGFVRTDARFINGTWNLGEGY